MFPQRLSSRQTSIILSSILTIVFVLAIFWAGSALTQQVANGNSIDTLKSQISKKQDDIKKLENQAKAYQETIKQRQSQAQTLKNKISLYEAEIGRLGTEIRLSESKIEEMDLRIEDLKESISAKEQDLIVQKKRLIEIIRNINNYDSASFMAMVLRTRSLSEIFNQAGYMEMLQGQVEEKAKQMRELKKQLEEEKANVIEKKIIQEELKSELEDQKETEAQQKKEHQLLLTKTKQSEKRYQQLLSETEEKQRQINQEIFDLEDTLKKALDPSRIPTARSGVLSWPTEGVISQGYGCVESYFARRIYPKCNNNKGGFHNGVDVAASQGTPIYSARNGKVIASGEAPYAYGKWIAVEHDNGLVTLYTHLSVKKAAVGDNVIREKTLIGYMGSSGLSSGPHLHFTVYAPGTFETKPSDLSGVLPIGATLDPKDYL